ncbi:MAG: hypothetical protein ACPL7G_11335 [Chloroflexia bacterium]
MGKVVLDLGRWLRGLLCRPAVAALGGYTALTLLITYPTVFVFSTHQAGDGMDSFVHLWLLWWTKTALFDLHVHPNQLSLLHYPQGSYNALIFSTPLIPVLAIPFQFFLSPWQVYNLFLMASFVLAGWSTFLLCYHITSAPLPSFIGGVIFAFAPFAMSHATAHFIQMMTFPFPLYGLALLRFLEGPTWKRAMVLGILLGLALQVHFLFDAYLLLPLTLSCLGYHLLRDRRMFARTLSRFLVAGMIGVLLWLPALGPFLSTSGEWRQDIVEPILPTAADDLVSFFLPVHSVFLRGDKPWGQTIISDITLWPEQWAYLGLLPTGWAIYGWIKKPQHAAPWLILAALALMICLGPVLQVGGRVVTIGTGEDSQPVPLPYALLQKIPFLELGRNPGRAAVSLMLALAVLAALGAAALQSRRKVWRSALLWLSIPLILLEYWTYWPFPVVEIRIPPFYQPIAADREPYGLLDYPIFYTPLGQSFPVHYPNYGLLYQMVHRHPIVGGHVWRLSIAQSNQLWGIQQVIEGSDIVIQPQANLRAANIRYVILHKFGSIAHLGQPLPDLRQQDVLLRRRVGTPIYEDDEIIAYETWPPEGPFVEFGPNWYLRNFLPQSVAHRWMSNDALLRLYLAEERCVSISFMASSYQQERSLDLLVNDRPLNENWLVAPEPHQHLVSGPFLLWAGENTLVFHTEDGCSWMDARETGSLEYCLSLDIAQVQFHLHERSFCSAR